MTKINKLTELDTLGVSLVKRGANRKRFALAKAEEPMDEIEILKAVLEDDTEFENAEQVAEAIEKAQLSAKAQSAVKGALRLLNAFKDELPEDTLDMLATMAGFPSPSSKTMDEDKQQTTKGEEMPEEQEVVKSEETVEVQVPAEIKEKMEALWKSQQEAIAKAEKLEAALKTERDERLVKEFVAKSADEYANIPGKAEDLGLLIKSLYDLDAERAVAIEAVLKGANAAIGTTLLNDIGSGKAPAVSTGSAWEQINQMAESMVEKSASPVSKAAMIAKALEQNPKLYNEYLAENAAQIS